VHGDPNSATHSNAYTIGYTYTARDCHTNSNSYADTYPHAASNTAIWYPNTEACAHCQAAPNAISPSDAVMMTASRWPVQLSLAFPTAQDRSTRYSNCSFT
jgi:hypothetical protein